MKLHCRARLNSTVKVTLRDGSIYVWTFRKEHRNWIEFLEGKVYKEQLRAFVIMRKSLQERSVS